MAPTPVKIPPPAQKYRCLVVDPPWQQGKTGVRQVRARQTTELDYPTLSGGALKEINLGAWAEEQAFIWLWVTNSKERGTGTPIIKLGFELLEHWGFTYYTTITWDKKTGVCPFGPYQIVTEHVLFGYRGKVKFDKKCLGKSKNLITAPPQGHSVKPAALYEHIRQWFPGPRLDVFARGAHPGFDGWGDQYQG